jgi:hypothetical protein
MPELTGRHPSGDAAFSFYTEIPFAVKDSARLRFGRQGELPQFTVTGEYDDTAKNHCAAVCLTNLTAALSAVTGRQLLENGSPQETFSIYHDMVGNGPVASISGAWSRYGKQRGLQLRSRPVRNFADVQAAISMGHPCAILLTDGPLQWHWVTVTGWAEGEGHYTLRIHDGWNLRDDRYYDLSSRPMWITGREYYIGVYEHD